MKTGYSSVPITFENITLERPPIESVENQAFLNSYFYLYSYEFINKYLQHNNEEITPNIVLSALFYSLKTFFTEENLKKLVSYIEDQRKEMLIKHTKENEDDNKLSDIESDLDSDVESEIDNILNNKELKIKTKCGCNFCTEFENIEHDLNDFEPKNISELIIYDNLEGDAPQEFIDNLIKDLKNV